MGTVGTRAIRAGRGRATSRVHSDRLLVELVGLRVHTPVIAASGTFGYGSEYLRLQDFPVESLGGFVLKTCTLRPRLGNPEPRIVETPGGLINSIGLQNVGMDALISEKLPELRQYHTNVIVSIAGFTVDEYREMAAKLAACGDLEAIEVNISCPNVEKDGRNFAHDPRAAAAVTRAIRKAKLSVPIIVKLSPNAPDPIEVGLACADAGADAVSLVNTFLGMAVDVERRRPILHMNYGGVSGPAVKPLALALVARMATELREHGLNTPLIGIGGIQTGRDALEFLIAGAAAVAVGTANFFEPTICQAIVGDIADYCKRHETTVADITGTLRMYPTPSHDKEEK